MLILGETNAPKQAMAGALPTMVASDAVHWCHQGEATVLGLHGARRGQTLQALVGASSWAPAFGVPTPVMIYGMRLIFLIRAAKILRTIRRRIPL